MSAVVRCLLTGFVGVLGARIAKRRHSAGDDIRVTFSEFEGAKPLGRIPAAAAACDGRLYVFGGETDYKSPDDPYAINRYLGDLWMFTPTLAGSAAAGTWTQLAEESGDGPAARTSASMVCSSGVLTLFGGIERTGRWQHETLGDVWSFDLAAGQWKLLQADSTAVGGPGVLAAHTAVLTDLEPDSMAVYGGHKHDGGKTDKVWIYSLSMQTWSATSPPFSPEARNFHTAVAMPGTSAFRMWSGVPDDVVWEFDVSSGAWSHAGVAPAYASGRMGAYFEGRLWSFGGFAIQGGGYLNELSYQNSDSQAFDVATATRATPQGRCYASMAALDGGLWIYGGYQRPGGQERLDSLWKATLA